MSVLNSKSIDSRLLRAAARYDSPEEMSEFVLRQLTPAQCAVRVEELLKAKSPLDEVQERRLLVIQVAEHLDWLKERRNNPDTWASISRMYKILSDQIERTNINVSDVSTKLASKYAEYFVNGYTMALERSIKELAKASGVEEIVDAEIIDESARVGISIAQEYLEKVTAREIE